MNHFDIDNEQISSMQKTFIKLKFNIIFPEAQLDVLPDSSCSVCFSDFFWEQFQLILIRTVHVNIKIQ